MVFIFIKIFYTLKNNYVLDPYKTERGEGLSGKKKVLKWNYVPFVITTVLVILLAVFVAGHDIRDIVNYTPENLLLACLMIWGFYALKSLSVVFPLSSLFIATGIIYDMYTAVLINLVGLCICFTIPYFVGRLSGGDLVEKIADKYPKARKMVDYGHDNNLFASYMSRAVVIVPGDIVSMIHGALEMPYKPYLLGSVLGVLPEMLVQTYLGDQLSSFTIKTFAVMVLLIAATLMFSIAFNKRLSRRRQRRA